MPGTLHDVFYLPGRVLLMDEKAALGARVRRALGRFEPAAAEAYRRFFIDLDAFADLVASVGQPTRLVEIGCGEGALLTRLACRLPTTKHLGIDITPHVGRLYAGPENVEIEFRQSTLHSLAVDDPGAFDVVVICDVLHHVPRDAQFDFLVAARQLVAPGGIFVLKDWIAYRTLATLAALLSDRYVTGDRHVRYFAEQELIAMLHSVFGPEQRIVSHRVPPWRSNVAFVVARTSEAGFARSTT